MEKLNPVQEWLAYFGVADTREIGLSLKWAAFVESADLVKADDSAALYYMFLDGALVVFKRDMSGALSFWLKDGVPVCLRGTSVNLALPF